MERQGESKLGIASLILSLISLITLVLKASSVTFLTANPTDFETFIPFIGLLKTVFNTRTFVCVAEK